MAEGAGGGVSEFSFPHGHGLVGWYFVTRDASGNVERQGRVIEALDEYGHFRVEFGSWLTSNATESLVMHFDEIKAIAYLTAKDFAGHDAFCDDLDPLGLGDE